MPTYQVLTTGLVSAIFLVMATGLIGRGRVVLCWSFSAYVLAVLTDCFLVLVWPERFFVFTFYAMKETVYAVLKILIAVEIWQRSFSSLPRARVRVGFLLVGALSTTAAAVHTIPTDLHPYDILMGILIPRFQAGTLILYATIVSASWWYRMPLHPFYRAIIMGFGAFLTVYTLLLSLLGVQSGSSRAGLWTAVLNAAAYIAVSTWWAWVAWRRAQAPSPIVARLQPWAKTW